MQVNLKDVAAGTIFVVIGGLFAASSLFDLDLGNALRMGPGFFPLLLAAFLVFLGLVIAIRAFGEVNIPISWVSWRGFVFILGPPILFGLTIRGLGFIPTVALVALTSSFASRRVGPLLAIALTAGLTIFTYLVFIRGLSLPIRPFGPWLV
jgi:hypothetical protein